MLRRVMMASGSVIPATDPYWANVVSLLHFDGADASTTFTDQKGKVWTPSGNAQIDTAQSKFGGASLWLDGAGDFVTTDDSPDFYLGNGDFTIEGFFNETAASTGSQIIGQHTTQSESNSSFRVSTIGGKLYVRASVGGVAYGTNNPAVHSMGVWHHFAFVRSASSLLLFFDGVEVGRDDRIGASSLNNSTMPVCIGATRTNSGVDATFPYFNGWIDDLRITKGVARYTANFTPPTAAFPNS